MPLRPFLRNTLALACALACGWWFHDAGTAVLAQRSGSTPQTATHSEEGLAFQLTGPITPDSALTLYNPTNRTLYIYPKVSTGSSTVNCAYSYRVDRPGAPLERQNCPVGTLLPPH